MWRARFIARRSASTATWTRTLSSHCNDRRRPGCFYAGSGITAISDPKAEYKETLPGRSGIFDAFRAEPVHCDYHHRQLRLLRLQHCPLFPQVWCSNGVIRNDVASVTELIGLAPRALVISPGPRTPIEPEISTSVVRELSGRVTILVICLGQSTRSKNFSARLGRIASLSWAR
ncbi:glutamine amidotransferase-related protein [Bradyrhizobium monzae]|uniref:glutamine amidotransferase-related protein n=1 Tax=Bradyrhizobium sp. Oc8 TaxID=2876780 RepID=UPI003209B475